MKYAPLAAAIVAVSCTNAPTAYKHSAELDWIGRTYNYERSNIDGTNAEYVSVHRANQDTIEVFKHRGHCTQAALVRGELNFDTFSSDTIVGGSLQPGGERHEFAFMRRDPKTGRMSIEVHLPDQTLAFQTDVPSRTWELYDFDLSNLTIMAPYRTNPRAGFDFDMVLAWADPSAPVPVRNMGHVHLDYVGDETRLGRATMKFALSGGEFGDAGGFIWLDSADRFLVEARLSLPNHPGYTDFSLRLLSVDDPDQEAWRNRLVGHFENCEKS